MQKPLAFFVAAAMSLCLTPLSNASILRPGEARPLQPLTEWLIKTGKASLIRGRLLQAMNLPAVDMPLLERGFRHEGEQITHVCSISKAAGFRDLVFFGQINEYNGDSLVWRTGPDGMLVSTVRIFNGVVERVPNDQYSSGFSAEKIIFLTRMRMAARSGTTERP